MMRLFVLAFLLPTASPFLFSGCASYSSGSSQRLFCDADQSGNGHLDSNEFSNIFMSFDSNHDKIVSKHEFEQGWQSKHLLYPNEAGFYFTIVDINEDLHVTQDDLDKLYNFFNDNGGSDLTAAEFSKNWNALFLL